ncbi:Serine acetyltransferase [termite gut metagenome]|uniref:Serine acetyltransferase n=1 Tax=termite gut metagenome TaxID=433724 RepID=A0A5J4QHF3_9ZZZZ
MNTASDYTQIITQTVDELSGSELCEDLFHHYKENEPLLSSSILNDIIERARAILFPGYYDNPAVNRQTLHHHIGVNVETLFDRLIEQILAAIYFTENESHDESGDFKHQKATQLAAKFIGKLFDIRNILATDVEAAYNGDPAAESPGEVICCYPAIRAISNYRIAYELRELGVPLIPRIITEMGHRETGIDIHPGAKIGNYFTIDHGTGVVIGGTSIIGNNVKLYQGVTLGARSFPVDTDGKPLKGIPRHPIIEDNVIIYSNATILGRITVGQGAVVGGNIWVTEDVPPYARIVQRRG